MTSVMLRHPYIRYRREFGRWSCDKISQALPPLFLRAGQRSYVELLRGRSESLGHGNEATQRQDRAISLCSRATLLYISKFSTLYTSHNYLEHVIA